MARKTNKTSHVLNLLTNGAPEAEETQNGQEVVSKEASTAVSEEQKAAAEKKVIVVNETSENEKLSNEIKNRLEAQFEEEIAKAASSEEPAGISAPTITEETALDSEEEPSESSESADEKEESGETPKQPAYRMMNVMEYLLNDMEDCLNEQMRQYGVCTCDRCRADVQALVLTQMPSKYVVVDESSTSPIIGYYENKYRTAFFTEIMKACILVKEKPRH